MTLLYMPEQHWHLHHLMVKMVRLLQSVTQYQNTFINFYTLKWINYSNSLCCFYYLCEIYFDSKFVFYSPSNELLNILCAFCSFYHASFFLQIQRSPLLPSSFPECRFHFHISRADTGSLRLLIQQDEADVETLWSYSHNTVSHWRSVQLHIGQQKQPYTVGALMSSR